MPGIRGAATVHAIRYGKNDTFLFPFTGVLPPNEGPRGGDTCPPPPHFLSGYNMDEHATDRAPGTRVGQPSLSRAVDRGHRPRRCWPRRRRPRASTTRSTSTTPAASASSSTSRAAGRTRSSRRALAGADQPRAPRRLRLRGQHRRRRRHPDPDAGPVPAQGRRAARHHAARRPGEYGVGLVFLPHDAAQRAELIEQLSSAIVAEEGQRVLGWRDVPTDDSTLGDRRAAAEPVIEQMFIGRGAVDRGVAGRRSRFERKLYVIRKRVEHAVDALDARRDARRFYVVSLSCAHARSTRACSRRRSSRRCSPTCATRTSSRRWRWSTQRFSTNTFPSWPLAHPYRYVAHNGEINTLRGNINWMRAREGAARSRRCSATTCRRCCRSSARAAATRRRSTTCSSSWCMTGRSLPHAMMMMIPEPWAEPRDDGPGAAGVLRVPLVADGAVGRPGVDRVHRRHA